jgi:hypothetical protein
LEDKRADGVNRIAKHEQAIRIREQDKILCSDPGNGHVTDSHHQPHNQLHFCYIYYKYRAVKSIDLEVFFLSIFLSIFLFMFSLFFFFCGQMDLVKLESLRAPWVSHAHTPVHYNFD